MKNKLFITTLLIFTGLTLFSCASKPKPPRERSETFVADINPFEVETFHLYSSLSLGNAKVSDFEVIFAPRTNYIYVRSRVGIDNIRIGIPYEERKKIYDAAQQYLEDYQNDKIPNTKATKKNAYTKGTVLFEWGAVGLAHKVVTAYLVNTRYLNPEKPYLMLTFQATEEEEGEHIFSPKTYVYISPSQWESIMAACNQEHLEAMTDQILADANAF